jgi:glycosyltransferase involved in cell wall biosynthesis
MPQQPEIALLVSTYQRPWHLRRALLSIALQRGLNCGIEVVVTDDGSTDETRSVVDQFADTIDFPVHFTTHPHVTFQLARCRNEGVLASTAPYLLFLDGDCVLPPDHVAIHLARRKPGITMAGNFVRIDQAASERVDEATIRSGEFMKWVKTDEHRLLRKQIRQARWYQWWRHPTKPKLIGNNVGIWRSDYKRINGYDENFEGWGCEDDDLRLRLRRAGVRIHSILPWTHTYHLWHPTDATYPQTWRTGRNVTYLKRRGVLIRCRNGMVKRTVEDLKMRVVGCPPPTTLARLIRAASPANDANKTPPELEIVFSPGAANFSGQAQCNVLVALDNTAASRRLARRAHIVVADQDMPAPQAHWKFRLRDLENVLKSAA